MQLIAAMGPPGGGRNTITERLLTRFNVINMTFPVEKQIIRIYGTMLNQQLFDFHPEVKGIGEYALNNFPDFSTFNSVKSKVFRKIEFLVFKHQV